MRKGKGRRRKRKGMEEREKGEVGKRKWERISGKENVRKGSGKGKV